MIDLNVSLAVASEHTLRQIERISHEDTLDGLREIKAAQVEVADDLLRDGVPAPEIQALLTDINQDIHRRVIQRHLAAMREAGLGEPPVEFALLIMGSGGTGRELPLPPTRTTGSFWMTTPTPSTDRSTASSSSWPRG